MIRFFKSPQPATLIIIPLIVLVFWARAFTTAIPVSDASALPIWDAISAFLKILPAWINFILLFAIISAETLYLNLMINKHEVLYKNTYIPALVFALIISSTPSLMIFHPIHIINLLIIRMLDRTFTLFKNEFPVSALFDSGFFTGLAALIYFPGIILLPLLVTALFVLRPFRLKEWLIMLIGFCLPFFFLSTVLYWNHSLIDFYDSYWNRFHGIQLTMTKISDPKIIVLAIYIGTLLLLSLIKLRMNYLKNIIRTRSYQQIFFIFLLFGAAWLAFVRQIEIIHFAFLAVPVSVFCSYYFVSARKKLWLYEYILWGLILVIVWNHLG